MNNFELLQTDVIKDMDQLLAGRHAEEQIVTNFGMDIGELSVRTSHTEAFFVGSTGSMSQMSVYLNNSQRPSDPELPRALFVEHNGGYMNSELNGEYSEDDTVAAHLFGAVGQLVAELVDEYTNPGSIEHHDKSKQLRDNYHVVRKVLKGDPAYRISALSNTIDPEMLPAVDEAMQISKDISNVLRAHKLGEFLSLKTVLLETGNDSGIRLSSAANTIYEETEPVTATDRSIKIYNSEIVTIDDYSINAINEHSLKLNHGTRPEVNRGLAPDFGAIIEARMRGESPPRLPEMHIFDADLSDLLLFKHTLMNFRKQKV